MDLLSSLDSDEPILVTVQDEEFLMDEDSELDDNSSSWTSTSRLPFPENVEINSFGMRSSSNEAEGVRNYY